MDEITILIIEDDEDIRESVKILLENEGFHVIEADNGMDGLHQISEDTDLVILDIMIDVYKRQPEDSTSESSCLCM